MQKIVILSGAGISAESGVKTFRDHNGLWENHRVEDVATPEGFAANPELVLKFYNQRRAQLGEVEPNAGHRICAELERDYEVVVVTQNVDDLHERAGSSRVIHLHGELKKVRPVDGNDPVLDWPGDLNPGDTDERGVQLRPHIVWFGESVPLLDLAAAEVGSANIVIIVGTSLQVYPAAGLVGYAHPNARIYYVDPNPAESYELQRRNIRTIALGGSAGLAVVRDELLDLIQRKASVRKRS